MKNKFFTLFMMCLSLIIDVYAQVPYFAATVGDNKLYGYTSLKFRPGENAQETYTSFQYGLGNSFATGVDLYTGNAGTSCAGVLLRYGTKINSYFNVGFQATPTFDLTENMDFSYITTAMYLNGAITLGNISSFVLYSRKFSGPINEAANIFSELQSALAAAERVFELLNEEEETADVQGAFPLQVEKGEVDLKHVDFGYDSEKMILKNINLTAEPGNMIAIVGPTGAGKTTIVNLLMRFYDPQSGEILIDGQSIYQVTRKSLRGSFSMVLQDTWLFNGTIHDNIAYGNPDATREAVIAAAKAAHIHGMIMRLPHGYDTVITEDGVNISKGQKQLMTIARAMLQPAHLLILDEATSNVDLQTEMLIQEAMRTLMRDKTCFVIAHRLSTIRNANLILVVNEGRIVEQGTHKTLMEKNGFYASLYRAQFE